MIEKIVNHVMKNYDSLSNVTGGETSKEQWNLEGRKPECIDDLVSKDFPYVDSNIRLEACERLKKDYGDTWVKKF